MLTLETGMYFRIEQQPKGPKPLPLESGFNAHTAYRALGAFNPSETSDAYFILSNDHDEVWFICNQHLRCLGVMSETLSVQLPLNNAQHMVHRCVGALA